jgi:hypothetical protein
MRASSEGSTWGIRHWLTLAIPARVISFSGFVDKECSHSQFRYAEWRAK